MKRSSTDHDEKEPSIVPPSISTSLSTMPKSSVPSGPSSDTKQSMEPLPASSYGQYVKLLSERSLSMPMSSDTQHSNDFDSNLTPLPKTKNVVFIQDCMALVPDLDGNPNAPKPSVATAPDNHSSNTVSPKASIVSPWELSFQAASAKSGHFLDSNKYVRVVSGDSISTRPSSLEPEPLPFMGLTEALPSTRPHNSVEDFMDFFPASPYLVQMQSPEKLDELLPTSVDNYEESNNFNARVGDPKPTLSSANQRVSAQDFIRLISTLENT